MPVQNLKYCEYFGVNEKYFPCIDESAINSGAAWDTTYPHQTFVDLLTLTEKMLSGNTNRSIWIHGAYGTGKSQCAYTLKKLLEVPENEVRAYWDKFEPLKKNPVLLEKLIGHKAQGIVTDKFFYSLLRIANYEDMLPEHVKSFLDEMTNHMADIRGILNNPLSVFMDIYAPYLEGFTEAECEEIKNSITSEMFTVSSTARNATVKKAAEDYRKNQVKSQLYKLWSDKTGGSKNPRVWSEKHRMPILCCMKDTQYIAAKKVFATLNSSTQSEADIKEALEFLQKADFFDDIASADYRDECFAKHIIGDYTSLISDMNAVRDALESTGISAYEWNDNPSIRSKVDSMANAEYNAGGSDKVVDIIESMDDAELKKWLTDIVRKDMGLGIKIIINKEE